MPVSSINPGFGSSQVAPSALKSALPQRSNATATPSASVPADVAPAAQSGSESSVTSLVSPTLHANRVGVAAYAAIMNPHVSTSMRTEA